MFSYFGIGINLFLFVLLLTKRNKSLADIILAIWLLVIACHLSLYALSLQPVTINNIHWALGTAIPFPLLHGPFLYLYTATSTNMLPKKRKQLILHFLPAVCLVLYSIPVFLLSAEEKMNFLVNGIEQFSVFFSFHIKLVWVSGFIYMVWCFYLLGKHKKNIASLFSYEEKINLNWLRYLIYSMALIWMIVLLVRNDTYIFNAVVIFVIFLGYFGIKQVGIFTQPALVKSSKEANTIIYDKLQIEEPVFIFETEIPITAEKVNGSVVIETAEAKTKTNGETTEREKKKYSNSVLTEDIASALHNQLVKLMAGEKTFAEPQLTLSMLAGKLNIHPNYLSQVINEKEDKNFFDYINTLRVEEFKRLLSVPGNKQFTMMSLAYDCGFNSKTAFYRNFKNITGQSPSDYLKQQNIQMTSE